ncbi:hypothetical protein M433DRAFT_152814 [Acidomyces richmondensis BFW]|nr:MAG: hypothetical protein FE78DRAFT_88229 [Acidomyces sp. 'richmondensis']KYG46941.1 hypothetical protein M433DRAFT_152814 [Acidomyces richmondensis BFW]
MRLLDVNTLTLRDSTHIGGKPGYAILSHTWGEQEVSFSDLADLDVAQQRQGFFKIYCTCAQAQSDLIQYAWVDTCCIDKSSSSELSEAINSMFQWYKNALVCYVFLEDVPGNCPRLAGEDLAFPAALRWIETFEESRWFNRGWTLQELIAPDRVQFFGNRWNFIGSLADLIGRVTEITGIPRAILDHTRPINELSIAQRLSWAAKRETTREEDKAYCLFGILDVNMPLLYGEGSRAFRRLQEQLISQSTDQSIFAWEAPLGSGIPSDVLWAPSPDCFLNGSAIRRKRGVGSESAFRISNKGLEITLPIIKRRLHVDDSCPYVTLGLLDCRYARSSQTLALVMNQHPCTANNTDGNAALELYVSGYQTGAGRTSRSLRLLPVSRIEADDAKPTLITITHDLQSQKYIKTFETNEASWFPLRFIGDNPTQVPKLLSVYPSECWHDRTYTMRLNPPAERYGGALVDIRNGLSVLVGFGVRLHQFQLVREVCGMVHIDPRCNIAPHLRALVKRNHDRANDHAKLNLGLHELVVAQLWRGAALNIFVETGAEDSQDGYGEELRAVLPSPPSPSRPRRDSVLQAPGSPKRTSIAMPDVNPRRVDFSPQCYYCRADRKSRREAEKKRHEDEKANMRRTRMTTAASGMTLMSIIGDRVGSMLELAEDFADLAM